MKTETLVFRDISDFDTVHIFECGQCFRWVPAGDGSGDYIGAAGSYAGRVHTDTQPDGRITLTLEVTGGGEEFWRDYFDLDTDYSEIKKALVASDPEIARAVSYGGGIRILNQDLFEALISFIISQNNNIPRIRKCIEAICARYGEHIGDAFGREWHAFPSPEALAAAAVEDIAALRLGYRSGYIKAAAERYLSCPRPETREDILKFLGVGPKVANCIMLFGLRDTGAFPIDTWVRHIMNDMYGFEEKDIKGMSEFACGRFGGYAGYAQQYLFYYYRDSGR